MIPTNEGILVDSCDPLFPNLMDFLTWEEVKRRTGRNLNRTLCGTYLLIGSEDDFPNYWAVKADIEEACRSMTPVEPTPAPAPRRRQRTGA